MADAVEVCSGSRQLLQILNRLGCTTSPDTHDRFVTQHAEAQRNKSLWCELSKGIFTVASVDNFDMLQSYAAVYCGDQSCSYHGTTIQLVQPSPKIVYCPVPAPRVMYPGTMSQTSEPELETREATLSTPCHRRSTSPGKSPHKLGKVGPKRLRTVCVRNLKSTCSSTSQNMQPAITYTHTPLTLANFLESQAQLREQKIYKSRMLTYVFQTYLLHQQFESNMEKCSSDM